MRILKFTLEPVPGGHSISIPKNSKLLSFAPQHGKLALWYLCPSVNPEVLEVKRFNIFYTEDNVPISYPFFIGTFIFS